MPNLLFQDIQNWVKNGKTVEAIIGIDERGTSYQALEFALTNFHQTYFELDLPGDADLLLKQAEIDQPYDYDIEIYTLGSVQYNAYLAVCNQTMPSGGKKVPRRFGWL